MMQRWKITIEYNGTNYHGLQIQPDRPTIQGAIEKAISKFSRQEVRMIAAGRTDAGVHAQAQIAHFDFINKSNMDGFCIMKAINSYLTGEKIAILHAELVDDEFHARFGAKTKIYTYKIINRPSKSALYDRLAWHVRKNLDVDAMHDAAQVLIGEHDFSSFRGAACQAKSPIRSIDKLDVTSHDIDGFGGREIRVTVTGQAFLHNQVRNIVGTLKLVGEGKWNKQDVQNALESRKRDCGGPCAPPDGLYLVSIDYN